MKVGDLVKRRLYSESISGVQARVAREQYERLGHGIVLSKQMAGTPAHPCVSVYYPKDGLIYDIAEVHMEVISETI